ncbi:hypothetical protein M408DRAFT_326060 [Serendipita vermifera MAFF 305830]|uniref:Uncharacterized protein n=1 Tax=Serendipita vermifera MAFF 305830 TaxID=933852 RepID=A0A0C3BMF2_SERVB|nr:hypothetical protein M408DRAFT_326060 [Serendipita vermifera MAFF 305830]
MLVGNTFVAYMDPGNDKWSTVKVQGIAMSENSVGYIVAPFSSVTQSVNIRTSYPYGRSIFNNSSSPPTRVSSLMHGWSRGLNGLYFQIHGDSWY